MTMMKPLRRKRFQKGSLQKRKHGRHWKWVGFWRENGGRPCKVLGSCSQMSKGEAEAAFSHLLRRVNEGADRQAKPSYTFDKFVGEVFLPFSRRTWKESTAGTSEQQINTHLVAETFGKKLLHVITREELQDFLERKAVVLGSSVVRHLRWFLNAILGLAESDGLIPNNPARHLRIPNRCKLGRDLCSLSELEVIQYLDALPLRERLIARFAIYEGMRPGEILALKWKSVDGDVFTVRERLYKGAFDTPKNGKSRDGAISAGTLELLTEWANVAQDPEGYVFPSERLATPLSRDNLWRRYMRPELAKMGLAWATFQVLRKTNASMAHKSGADPKVSADQRGHGIGVSMDTYTSSDIDQKRAAMQKLEIHLAPKRRTE